MGKRIVGLVIWKVSAKGCTSGGQSMIGHA